MGPHRYQAQSIQVLDPKIDGCTANMRRLTTLLHYQASQFAGRDSLNLKVEFGTTSGLSVQANAVLTSNHSSTLAG